MTVKDLLVLLRGHDGAEARLEAALTLAETFGAHLSAACLVAEPYMPAVAGFHMPADLVKQQLDAAERAAEALLATARERADRRGISIEVRRETSTLDRLPALLARQARHADLTIVGQPAPAGEDADDALLAEAAFMDSGRPALTVPSGWTGPMPPTRVMLAWDGSREAARAAGDALPLLRLAGSVTVLVVDAADRSAQLGAEPGADIATHLARHNVKVEVRRAESGSAGIGNAILDAVRAERVELLAMGGYGHSRLREMFVGGVTRHLLAHAPCPLLLSH